MKNGRHEYPRSVVGNLYTPSERPGGTPVRHSLMLVLAVTILTAALVLAAVGYLSAYAIAGKNEQRRARLKQDVGEREARVNALCAMVDAVRAQHAQFTSDQSQRPVLAAERTDYIGSQTTPSRAARQPDQTAWLVKSKARIASVISGYAAAVFRPAAAEPARLPAQPHEQQR